MTEEEVKKAYDKGYEDGVRAGDKIEWVHVVIFAMVLIFIVVMVRLGMG